MSRRAAALILAAAGALLATAACLDDRRPAPPASPADFASAFSFSPRLDEANGRLVVDVRMQEGFHAYAPGERIGRPVELSVLPTGGWSAAGAVALPAGRERDLGPLGRSVVLEDAFTITLPVSPGAGALAGELKIQVCTNDVCEKPRVHRFEVARSTG